MNFAVIDIETTGLSPKSEKITEIAIYIHDGKEVIDHYSTLINPECSIPYEISMLTGIRNEMVINAPKFYEVAKKIEEFTKDCIFVAHNVNFDYGFVQAEFKSLGFDYKRTKLCTARFARKHLKSLRSFSLKNLCKHFNIDLEGHHRADADAGATVKLLEHLLRIKDQEEEPDEDTPVNLPPAISQKFIDSVPNTPGVYYLYNSDGKLLYIGKSVTIRTRLLSHFRNFNRSKGALMALEIADIKWTETGSELIALLLESDEIKTKLPPYNSSQKRVIMPWGIEPRENEKGFITFDIKELDQLERPLIEFQNRKQARDFLEKETEAFELCKDINDLIKCSAGCLLTQIGKCSGASQGDESAEVYNAKASAFIEKYSLPKSSFLIIEKGRASHELAAIHIEKGEYKGWGYFDSFYKNFGNEHILQSIQPFNDNKDIRRIIKGFIQRNKVEIMEV